MIYVIPQAEPTELILTSGASHVHATVFFLDITFTFGTWLSVKFNPLLISVGAKVCFIYPCLQNITRDRPMGSTTTFKAPIDSTFANNIYLLH